MLWDPPIDSPVLKIDAEFAGNGANSFDHNLIETSAGWMLDDTSGKVALDGNRYVHSGDGRWIWKGMRFAGLAEFQKGAEQEAKGSVARTDPGFWRAPKPQPLAPELAVARLDWKAMRGHYVLVAFLDSSTDSRGEAVVLRSAAAQYGRRILKTVAISPAPVPVEWSLKGVQALTGPLPKGKAPLTFLIDPYGQVLYRWAGYAPAKEIVFAIRKLCGAPLM